ncbi:MAG: acyl carrier protein [Sulfitobacter sp.]
MTKSPGTGLEAMHMQIKDQVIEIIAEQAVLDPEDVTLDSTLESLGIDSLGLVESIFAIEEAFDISIPFNANNPTESDFDISNVASIIAGIERLKAAQV